MKTYKRVALLGVDGAGAFFKDASTPNLDRIFENGSVAWDVITSTPSISAECWGSMLHGVTPDIHRLTNGIVSSRPYDTDSPFPSVFRVIREKNPHCELASFCNWNPINFGIIEAGMDVTMGTGKDEAVTDQICAYLADHDPKLLFVQFDEVDGAGHKYCYGTAEHLNQIAITDGYIERIYRAYEKRGFLEDTLFIVTADHGGINHSHGGDSEGEMKVMFALAGETVEKNGGAVEMQIRDTASIVLYALGYDQPETWTGMVPTGVFEGVTAGERPVYEIPYAYDYRVRASVPTPDTGLPAGIKERAVAYLPFDGNTASVTGAAVEEEGKLYFIDGYYGRGIRLDDGSVTLPDFTPGKDSFTLSFWLKTPGGGSDPAIASNKNWQSGKNPGFILALTGSNILFNAGNGEVRMDESFSLPLDAKDGWVHVLFSVDRDANTIALAYDFGTPDVRPIPERMSEASFDGISGLVIGQDGTKSYGAKLPAVLDEFLLLRGPAAPDDLSVLAEYYGC